MYSDPCLQISSILPILDALSSFCELFCHGGGCCHQDIGPEICVLLVAGEDDAAEEYQGWSIPHQDAGHGETLIESLRRELSILQDDCDGGTLVHWERGRRQPA